MGKQEENVKFIIALLNERPRTEQEIIDEMIKKNGNFSHSSWTKYTGHINKKLSPEGKCLKISNKVYRIEIVEATVNTEQSEIDLAEDDENSLINNEGQQQIQASSPKTVKEVLALNALATIASKKPLSVKNGVATKEELAQKVFFNDLKNQNKDYENVFKIVLDNKLKNTVGLLQKGYVNKFPSAKRKKEDRFSLTAKAPVYLKLDIDSFFDLRDLIQYSGQGYAFPDILEDIDNLMSLMIDDDKYDGKNYQKKTGLRGNNNTEIERFLKKLGKTKYRDYCLEITYKAKNDSKAKKSEVFIFEIGLAIYASDKDKLYFIGRKYKSSEIMILNTERISKMKETDISNVNYGNIEYLNIYNEMFSISVEEPFSITVEFDRALNIESKLRRLKSVRPEAIIYIKNGDENKIVYKEEKVRGIEDVAKWLRSFGSSAKVIEPEILKNRMKDSILKTLKEYGEEIADE